MFSAEVMRPAPTEHLGEEVPEDCTEQLVTGMGFTIQQFPIPKEHKVKSDVAIEPVTT